MGSLGWAEVAVIVVVALVVLGPDKLPGAARQIGNFMRQIRKISTGFQQELQNALDEPIEAEARRKGQQAVEQSKVEDSQAGGQSKVEDKPGVEQSKVEDRQAGGQSKVEDKPADTPAPSSP